MPIEDGSHIFLSAGHATLDPFGNARITRAKLFRARMLAASDVCVKRKGASDVE